MVKLEIYNDNPKEKVVSVRLELSNYGDDTIVVEDNETGMSLVGFKLVGGKVKLIRYFSVSGEAFDTNAKGQLNEIPE